MKLFSILTRDSDVSGHHEEHFYEIMNLDSWFMRCLRYFLSTALVAPLAERNHLCNFSRGHILRTISVKLFCIWTSGSDVV